MTMGLLEGLTSAIGDELNVLAGHRITRLVASFLADAHVREGVTTASSSDLGITINLVGDTFTGAAPGHILRVTSGTQAGKEAAIAIVNSSTQITLTAPGIGANFTNQSWEILSRQTTAQVESTLDWDSSGRFYIDGVLYAYTSKTLTSLIGVQHFDDVSFKPGARKDHPPLAEVLDYARTFSALDKLRRSLFVGSANGAELNVIGSNLSVPRPPLLADAEVYRKLIQALSYAPRGTVYALELALDALFGPGNHEIFEDLVLGSLKHAATVFFRRNDGNDQKSAGKAFLEGFDRRVPTSTTTVIASQSPFKIRSVLLAGEKPPYLVAEGTNSASSINGGGTITGSGSPFLDRILKGDIFEITSGTLRGKRGTISAFNFGPQQITIGSVDGSPNYAIAGSFTNVSWRVVRELTNCRWYKPSADVELRYPGDTGTAVWEYIGTIAEATYVNLASAYASQGAYLEMDDEGGGAVVGDTVAYRHKANIDPESRASFAVNFNIGASYVFSLAGDNAKQLAFSIADGERLIVVGGTWDGATQSRDIHFITDAGAAIASINRPLDPLEPETLWRTYEIVKTGRNTVVLLEDGQMILSAPYALFSATMAREFVFGNRSTSNFGQAQIRSVEWKYDTLRDFWNVRRSDGETASPNQLLSASSPFTAADATAKRRVRFHPLADTSAPILPTAVSAGEWEVASFVNAGEVTVLGPTEIGGTFNSLSPTRFIVRGDREAFTFPDVIGHKLEILDGVNAGAPGPYTIAKVLDAKTLQDLSHLYDAGGVDIGSRNRTFRQKSHVIEVTGAAFKGTDTEAKWRIVPQFGGASNLTFEIVERGTLAGSTLTLPEALPITPGSGGIVDLLYTTVRSAQVLDERGSNVEGPPGTFSFYPFYLSDQFSWLRLVLKAILPAGIFADFDKLIRNASGPHIIE